MDAVSQQIARILVILASSVGATSAPPRAGDGGELSVVATSPQEVWSAGESPLIHITLTNTGRRPLWIPSLVSFGVIEPDEFDTYQAWAVATDKDRMEIISTCQMDYAHRAVPYKLLQPGSSLSFDHRLHCFYLRPGEFIVRVYYWDRSSRAPPTPDFATRLATEVSSAPLEIRIVKSPRAVPK
jgi:hypothetical protein